MTKQKKNVAVFLSQHTDQREMFEEAAAVLELTQQVITFEDNNHLCMYLEELASLDIPVKEGWWPNIILLDLELPRMAALDIFRKLRADSRFRKIRIIAIVGPDQQYELTLYRNEGLKDYISKPSSWVGWLDMVSGLFRTKTRQIKSTATIHGTKAMSYW